MYLVWKSQAENIYVAVNYMHRNVRFFSYFGRTQEKNQLIFSCLLNLRILKDVSYNYKCDELFYSLYKLF